MQRRASVATPNIHYHQTPSSTNSGVPVRKSRLRRRTSSGDGSSGSAGASTVLAGNKGPRRGGLGWWGSSRRSSRSVIVTVGGTLLVLWMVTIGVVLFSFHPPQTSQVGGTGGSSAWSLRGSALIDRLQSFHVMDAIMGSRGGAAAAAAAPDATLPPPNEKELVDMRELSFTLPFDNPDGGAWKQGWDVQPRPYSANDPLTILVVPHSHCDPGWIKTFDEYFRQQTSSIITTVITSLLQDPKRTFIWAEISYFAWWWEDQDDDMRSKVKKLLQDRQFEFVTGGWVQPDEANSELYAMEIQLQEGHDWIRDNLGAEFIPRYSWSIDPFGYSPTMAYLLKKYGFRGMLIQRVHYAVKKELARRKHLEFYWRQTWGGGDGTGVGGGGGASSSRDMFAHVMPFFSYDVPHTCGPDPAVCCQFDFHRMPVGDGPGCPWNKEPVAINDENVRERSMLALDQYLKKASLYRGNVVLIPLGDDFRYQKSREATLQYENHQRIHDYINRNVEGITIKFGTLSEYFDRTIGQFSPPVLKGSFFTYCDVNEDYWSGYFTSRVFDKALDRQLERVLYAASMMGANKTDLRDPRRALSLFQHHDGVTGTAKNHVVADYARRMHEAIRFTQSWMVSHLRQLFPQEAAAVSEVKPCIVSKAPRDVGQNVCNKVAVLYNPLETPQTCGVVTVPGRQVRVGDLPCEQPGPLLQSKTPFKFDPATGLMLEPVREEWKVWKVNRGGAYLFFPGELVSYALNDVRIEKGGFVVSTQNWKRTIVEKEVPTEFGTKATVIDYIFEIDLDRNNEEWIVRFGGDILNKGVSHTDLNGFNFDTHRFRKDMPIQSQVFPMPTLASIQDNRMRMTVMSEHAQGTASLKDGTIDIWLDRRLAQDDSRGLEQGVTDNRPTRTRLRLLLEKEKYEATGEFRISKLNRLMWQQLQHPLEMFGPHGDGLSPALPENIEAAAQRREAIRQQRMDRPVDRMRRSLNETSRRQESGGSIFSKLSTGFKSVLARVREFRFPRIGLRRQSSFHATESKKIPFVFMIHKRVDYMKKAIDSLRKSDFPKSKVPIIVSHDGRMKDMVEYIDSLKSEFQVIQLFHPHACFDHPYTFPGNDTSLNEGFKGDSFGNHRESWVTCAKHHFTWLLKTVFDDLRIPRFGKEDADPDSLSESDIVDTFLFLEEDYIVAPTIYEALVSGLNIMEAYEDKTLGGFLGIGLDPTRGGSKYEPINVPQTAWIVDAFHSGPMTLSRTSYEQLREHASEYCRFDDYNWDWSLVHVQTLQHMPHTLLMPAKTLAKHIGVTQGMHSKDKKHKVSYGQKFERLETRFVGTELHRGNARIARLKMHAGYGGWSKFNVHQNDSSSHLLCHHSFVCFQAIQLISSTA
jgi:Glycosyl hydrolases family 38 N-terminal domain/N-acetylglucosaminyltransferase II (MGAT2)/Alpha mannosidase middle domain/Glycosyl hydrolases family 38 C-terminal domain